METNKLNELADFLGEQINQMNEVKNNLGNQIFEPNNVLEPEVYNVKYSEYPEFQSAFLSYGLVADKGKLREMNLHELDQVSEDYPEWILELCVKEIEKE